MNLDQALENFLPSFKQYYDVNVESPLEPFKAEAKFVSHAEQYFLVHSAKLSDIDSSEHVYFSTESGLTEERARELCEKAWEDGLKTVTPYYGHRNSDVTVFIFCENTDKKILKKCRKIVFSKTYKFSIYGWSNFKLVLLDINEGKAWYNRYGGEYTSLMKKYIKKFCR